LKPGSFAFVAFTASSWRRHLLLGTTVLMLTFAVWIYEYTTDENFKPRGFLAHTLVVDIVQNDSQEVGCVSRWDFAWMLLRASVA
jgi:hypothetical protein